MKKKFKKHLQLNKINVSKLNLQHSHAILGGNTANTCPGKTNEETCPETCGDTCTTSRFTVDFSSKGENC
ncbi:class I lanthipeptide [Kordia algicida OT-1]|uniref:Uncharacterized protein n=1 Tax=Kordia algicida OT-1 TaxID=391587 RepID=A9DWX1_9FLAO|nr:class I lanthipeptide [Kordia algicida]EDP95937.1 hypothetical protein KAOT1_07208 [Kordia algicida OT-1]